MVSRGALAAPEKEHLLFFERNADEGVRVFTLFVIYGDSALR